MLTDEIEPRHRHTKYSTIAGQDITGTTITLRSASRAFLTVLVTREQSVLIVLLAIVRQLFGVVYHPIYIYMAVLYRLNALATFYFVPPTSSIITEQTASESSDILALYKGIIACFGCISKIIISAHQSINQSIEKNHSKVHTYLQIFLIESPRYRVYQV